MVGSPQVRADSMNPSPTENSLSRPQRMGLSGMRLALAALGCLAVLGALAIPQSLPSFWSADNGFKWWQAKTFAERGPREGTLKYTLVDLDPEGRYQPLGQKFGKLEGDQLRFSYSPWWALILSPFAGRDAYRGALLLTAVFGAVVLVLCAMSGALIGLKSPILFATAISLCSPLIVYSLEPNEHIPTLALGLTAWVLVAPSLVAGEATIWRGVAAGALSAMAALARNEYALWGVSLAVTSLIAKRGKLSLAILLGLGATLFMGLALQSHLFPTAEPLRGAQLHASIPQTTFSLFYLRYRWALLNHWLFSAGHYREREELALFNPFPWALPAIVLLTFSFGRFARKKWGDECMEQVLAGFVFCFGSALALIWFRIHRAGLPHVSSLLLVFPILSLVLLLPLAKLRADRRAWVILALVGIQCVLVLLLAGNSRGGRQWGPRYLMVTWPLLAALGWRILEELLTGRAWWRLSAPAPLLLAMVLSVWTAGGTVRAQQGALPLDLLKTTSLEAPEEIFLTDLEYLPGAAVGIGIRNWLVFPPGVALSAKKDLISRALELHGRLVWIGRKRPESFLPASAKVESEREEHGFVAVRCGRKDEKSH
ncbi:MAG: hypothetical protein GHCLOJNM_02316 [bacterium]|nr:hypothetical protein [bacterium]